jgi:hypothetical protein
MFIALRAGLAAGCVLLLAPDSAFCQPAPRAEDDVTFRAPAPREQATPLKRHWSNEWFRDRDYFDPLIAEPRAPQIAFTFPAWANDFQFSVEPGTRLVWEVSLGREIPIFARANFDDSTRVFPGSQGFGFWVDVSFHMIEDMGNDPSNPIINTDYRFSLGKVKYYRVISVSKPDPAMPFPSWKSIAFRGDLYHHESTHLGDEFVIQGQAVHPDFERINVSFEFYDITGAFNWERGDGLMHTIRGGTTGLISPSDGYYSDHTLAFPKEDEREVFTTERNFEPYVQYQFFAPHIRTNVSTPTERPSGGSVEQPVRWAFFASADARRRIVYDYHKPSQDVKEDTQWSFNLLAGLRSQPGNFRFSIKEFYGRVYYGVNPNGQLRSIKDYWLVGFGVNFAVGDR